MFNGDRLLDLDPLRHNMAERRIAIIINNNNNNNNNYNNNLLRGILFHIDVVFNKVLYLRSLY